MLNEIYKDVCTSIIMKNSMGFVNNPCVNTANRFIEDYFESHSKGILFNKCLAEPNSMYSKSIHTVSAFLLGMKFKKICKTQIEKQIKENAQIESQLFEYPWLLACLYHDVFSDYENNHDEKFPKSLHDFISGESINHTIYSFDLPDEITLKDFKPIYKKESVEEYYVHMIKSSDKEEIHVDHGIISGYYAFDRLTENFIENWKQKHQLDEFTTEKDNHTLVWNKNQIWIFAFVADAIIAHHIWHTDDMKTVSKELWPNPNNKEEVKLSISKTPLAYFLSLIDTIEPYKFFERKQKATPQEVFTGLSIEMHLNQIVITKDNSFEFDFKTWYDAKMKNMSDWLLNTSALLETESKIIIFLPENT